MKRNVLFTLLACGAGLILSAAAQAQTPAPTTSACPEASGSACACHAGHGGGVLQHLTYELGLSGSQQAQIAPILEAAQPQMKAIHDQAKTQFDSLVNSVSAQITPLLTPDQQTKFSAMVQKLVNSPAAGLPSFQNRRGPGGFGGPVERLQKLAATLGLSDDQKSQIKPILEAAHTQVKSILANTSLTPEQKHAQVKETMKAAHAQIKGILTPEQQAQIKALREKFHYHGQAGASASPGVSGTN